MNHDFFGIYAKNIYRESEMQGEFVNCLRSFDIIACQTRQQSLSGLFLRIENLAEQQEVKKRTGFSF